MTVRPLPAPVVAEPGEHPAPGSRTSTSLVAGALAATIASVGGVLGTCGVGACGSCGACVAVLPMAAACGLVLWVGRKRS